MVPKCPACGSVIYSRRNVLCGVCRQRLPNWLLFSPDELQAVERDLKEAKRRMHEAIEDRRASEAPR